MKTVQVAIHDPEYADWIRSLLLHDGGHRVQLVNRPDVSLDGVIVMDAMDLGSLPLLAKELERLVVIVRKECDDLSKVWDAGVRHVVFRGDPPETALTIVLGVELSMALTGAASPAISPTVF
jgi:hypothetical protein